MTLSLPDGLAFFIVFIAYFVKGFSGFGPALILIPVLTLIYDPATAISVSTLFDLIAGPILFIPVYKQINWKFVAEITAFLFIGAYFGALLLNYFPAGILRNIIACALFLFIIILLLQKEVYRFSDGTRGLLKLLRMPVSLAGGFSGGLIGISGPIIVIYMKILYQKTFFRSQLIAIFMLGAAWRFLLYRSHNIIPALDWLQILMMTLFMLSGLWFGQRYHARVDEKLFNRIVAVILVIPALNLIFSN